MWACYLAYRFVRLTSRINFHVNDVLVGNIDIWWKLVCIYLYSYSAHRMLDNIFIIHPQYTAILKNRSTKDMTFQFWLFCHSFENCLHTENSIGILSMHTINHIGYPVELLIKSNILSHSIWYLFFISYSLFHSVRFFSFLFFWRLFYPTERAGTWWLYEYLRWKALTIESVSTIMALILTFVVVTFDTFTVYLLIFLLILLPSCY